MVNFFHFFCILHRKSYKQTGDPDQIQHLAASELGLHCLHVSKMVIWSENLKITALYTLYFGNYCTFCLDQSEL